MIHESEDKRPGLAMIANCLAPYRVYLHRLIAEGIPEFKLHTLITHDVGDFKWTLEVPESIHVRHFGRPGDNPIADIRRAPLHEWRKGGQLFRYLEKHDVRAVVLNGYRYLSYLRTIARCHRANIPLFVSNDSNIRGDGPLPPLRQWLKFRIYAWWVKRVSGVMPMGELGRQFFAKYGADPRRMYLMPCVPDYDAFETVREDRLEGFRRQFGLSTDRRYFVFSGRLVSDKRVDLLIDAFTQIASERPEWDLLIVGDGVLREGLQERVPEPLQSRAIWTGFLEQESLALAYHAADVLVLPSERDPWAVVVLEAMAAGLAIVASDVIGAPYELIRDQKGGRLFPNRDVQALAESLLEVSQSERLMDCREQARLALSRWRQQLDPVKEVRRALVDVRLLEK